MVGNKRRGASPGAPRGGTAPRGLLGGGGKGEDERSSAQDGWMKNLNRFLAALCIIALTGAVVASQRSEQRAKTDAESLRDDVRRRGVGERFAGDTLPTGIGAFLHGIPSGPEDDRPVLLWLVVPESCNGCLGDPRGWNALAASERFIAVLVVEGDSVSFRRAVRAVHPATRLVMAPPGAFQEALGYPFGSLRLVADPDGRLIAADSRVPMGCG
jgi:hypothetical protein